MAGHKGYDDDDMDDRYSDSHGHSTSSYSGGKAHSDKTSDFNTMVLSEDGRFLGIKLPDETAKQLRLFSGGFLDWARKKAEVIGIPLAEKIAKSFGAGELHAKHVGGTVGDIIGYGVIFSDQIAGIWQNLYSSTQKLNELRLAVQPLAKSGGVATSTSPLSGDNEVVANARKKIKDVALQRGLQTLTGAITIGPAFYGKFTEQQAKNLARQEQLEWDLAKNGDKDALKRLVNKELNASGIASEHGLGARMMEEIIEGQRKQYGEKWDVFKKANEREVKKVLEESLVLDENNYQDKLEKLKNLGFETWQLSRANGDAKNAISEFWKANKKTKDRVLERTLRGKFVRQYGAFDHEWEKDRHFGNDEYRYSRHQQTPPTIKEQWEQKFAKREETRLKAKEEEKSGKSGHDKNTHGFDFGTMAAGIGAGFLSELARKILGGKTLEKYQQPIALDRILHLRRSLEKAGENPSDLVPGIALGKGNDKDMGYVRYVHNIFQQHQKDCDRTEIGDRFTEHFEKARWDDAAILELPDNELTAYEYAVKTIAQRIKTGRMDAIALIELAGDKQKKIVHADGRSFGPHGAGKDEAAVKEAVQKIIDEKTVMLHAGQAQSDEQINEKLGNFVFSVEDLKKALESKELDQRQRAFIFTVFSDVVGSDEKLCGKIGVSMERCQELRKECTETFQAMLDGAVNVLAEMIENEPEKLEKHLKLTDKEKKLILSMAGRAKEEGKDVADLAANPEELKSLETSVANAAVVLSKAPAPPDENGKPQGFWQRVVAATRKPKKKLGDHATDAHAEEEAAYSKHALNGKKSRFDGGDEFDDSNHKLGAHATDAHAEEDAAKHTSHARAPDAGEEEEFHPHANFMEKHRKKHKPNHTKHRRDAEPSELGL